MTAPSAMRSNHRAARRRRFGSPSTMGRLRPAGRWRHRASGIVRSVSEVSACPRCGASVPPGARFCPACGALLKAEGVPGGEDGRGTEASGVELRPITALFADVVGSTSLGERLKPDEVKALIGECVSRMSHAVEEFGGTVQAYMGDGIAAYFGIPVAHEDDAERAARAALRILDVVGEYATDIADAWGITDFDVRVGLNSGQVGVGMVGAANPQEVGLGDTTNVAARLQSAAEPGTISVGEPTARLLAHGFDLQPLGVVPLKGRDRPVAAWRLAGIRSVEEATGTPLVGRDAEMDRLRTVLDELLAGRGQVVSLVGEVGIGKTRLMNELESVAGDRVTWLEGRCPSYGGELLYWPFVEMLRDWLGVAEGDAEVAVRTRLRARMGLCLGTRLDDLFPYLARLLSLKLEPDVEQELQERPADLLGRHVKAAYRGWIEALTETRPVVVAIDDLQWADLSTRELAETLLEVTDRAPLLVVTTYRPDPASEAWRFRLGVLAEFPHRAVEVQLGPLLDRFATELAEALIPGGRLDEHTRAAIVDRAEGNPLYLEELLRGLIESGALERRRTWTLTTRPEDLLPPALESLLVARIDRLPPEPRRLIQVAAVIGRTFPERVLDRVAAPADLAGELAVLLRAGLIREHRRFPEFEYTFRHGLLQEAALSTIPPAARQERYGEVAAAFEEVFSGSIGDHLEVLAHYYAQSRDLAKALDYLERAGEKAVAAGATAQAEEMRSRARKVAKRIGDRS
jgi:class 3 adenylate cyclase